MTGTVLFDGIAVFLYLHDKPKNQANSHGYSAPPRGDCETTTTIACQEEKIA